jgi:6-phosphogluconolactonase
VEHSRSSTKIQQGGAPCYVSLSSDASLSLIANYSGGNVTVLPLDKSGMLQSASDVIQHEGYGADSLRQGKPHAHSIVLDPNEKYALAVDLGIDKVISYSLDKDRGALLKASEFETEASAGPRHLVFHNNGQFVYIINELNSTIISCEYNSNTGSLSEITTVNTLPDNFTEDNYCADIHISKDGRFLYGSNRGHDSIVVFEIDQQSGQLEYISHHSVKGEWPRNFTIDPSGQYLLVANQKSDNIVVFKIDEDSGRLQETGVEVSTSMPVCLKMMPIQ